MPLAPRAGALFHASDAEDTDCLQDCASFLHLTGICLLTKEAPVAPMLLQMMMTVDGMVSGPHGELDWMDDDEQLARDHLAILQQAELIVLGAGVIAEMSSYWTAAENDAQATELNRAIGHAMNAARKIVYSHHDQRIDWHGVELHVVGDDEAFVEDVTRAKRSAAGPIVTYGGVRMARSLLQHGLVDEVRLDICPVVLAAGQRLFDEGSRASRLRLRDHGRYRSGTTLLHYDVVPSS